MPIVDVDVDVDVEGFISHPQTRLDDIMVLINQGQGP
jgi:hypothetical protein